MGFIKISVLEDNGEFYSKIEDELVYFKDGIDDLDNGKMDYFSDEQKEAVRSILMTIYEDTKELLYKKRIEKDIDDILNKNEDEEEDE